jgi:Tol biopolymer transport system component
VLRRARALTLLTAALVAACTSAAAEELRQPQKLTVSLADDLLGQLSGDGRRLYFVSNRDATNQIFTQDLTAPASTLLFDEGADATWPRLSPDGRRLAYVSFADDASGRLCVRELPSLSRRCLGTGGALEASWASADELVLLARGAPDADLTLSRVRVDGRRLAATPLLARNLNGPSVSPDGKWLVFVPLTRAGARVGPAFAASAGRALVFRRLDGSNETAVQLELPGGTTQPAFSADGKWLYFTQFLNDTDQNGVLDGDDHGVIFRVPFAGDPSALARALPEQLTGGAWNCQYPAPSATRLIITCAARAGSLDLYALPLDGMIPSSWSRARVAEEAEASRERWEQLMLLHRVARAEPDPLAQATQLLEIVRLHLGLGEYEAALFHARALGRAPVPSLAQLAPLLEPLIAERRALRAFDRGELGHRYLVDARLRVQATTALAPLEPAAAALRHLVLSELADHLGDKGAAVAELQRATVDAHTPAFVVQLLAARAEELYRELDRADDLLRALGPLVDHPALPEGERLRLGGVYARALMRTLPPAAAHAAAASDGAAAAPGSARAFCDALWACLDEVAPPTLAQGRACVQRLYDGNRAMARRRLIVTEVVRRAEETDADDLEYELTTRWVRDVPNDAAEERHAERLFRHVVEDYAYAALAVGRFAAAAAEFESVTREALSLESHIGVIEASLAAGRDVDKAYARLPADAPVSHFVRAYLDVRRLPTLDGEAFDRAWAAAEAEVLATERALPQKCEVQALHGALLHLRYLRLDDRASAEQANTHYLLALDLAHENARYRAMVLEELALLHAAVGNFRIALGHFEEREKLPFAEPQLLLGHELLRARALLHLGRSADAAKAAAVALALVNRTPALAPFRALALDRAALYALDAGDGARAVALYDDAERAAPAGAPPRNRLVRWLARAAAAVAAGQPAHALADLDRLDRALADAGERRALDWPDTPSDEVRETYDPLRLGLRGQAERALGRSDEARRTLGRRHQLLLDRARRRGYDADLLELSEAEAQLADLERQRGDGAAAAAWATQALARADQYADKTRTPMDDAQLRALAFAAELCVVGGAPTSAFGFDVRARLVNAFETLARTRDPARREIRVRIGVYLTLLTLDRQK